MLKTIKKITHKKLFTTPSHSQKLALFSKLKQFYKYDISETDTHNPQDALKKTQERAAKIYGTKSTYYLTNGSTSGVIASVLTCTSKGDNVLLWDNAHQCHLNAVKLAGANPIFYELEKDSEWGIYKAIEALKLEQYLKQAPIKAVIVTSPSYYGVISDIKRIKEVCQKYNSYLIVDEAHGALYPFGVRESAIYQGADFTIQSLHKTAGGLNPTALLHNNTTLNVQNALDMISTTSPSYPLLASIEKNINFLNSQKGRKKIQQLISDISNLKNSVKTVEFSTEHDPTKILIKKNGMSGYELSEFLYKNNIEDEKTNEISTMLLCGIGTNSAKLDYLAKILKKL